MPNLKEILELAETFRLKADDGDVYAHGVADALEWATGIRKTAPGETTADVLDFYSDFIAISAQIKRDERFNARMDREREESTRI